MQGALQVLITFLITVAAVFFATLMFRKVAGTLSPTKLNIVSYTYYALLVFSVIGAMFIAMGFRVHYHQWAIRHWQTAETVWQLILILFVAMPTIMYLIGRKFRFQPAKEYTAYRRASMAGIGGDKDRAAFFVVFMASLLCVGAVVYTFKVIGNANNPILNLIRGTDPETLARLRTAAGQRFQGSILFRNIFAITLTPVVSYIALAYTVKTKKWYWGILFAVLFVASCLIKFYDLMKAPIIYYILSLFILMVYCGMEIHRKWIVRLGVLFAVLIVAMYIKIAGTDLSLILSVRTGPVNRIFITSTIALFYHFELFTYLTPFLKGASFPPMISVKLLGFDRQVRSGAVVMQTIAPRAIDEGTAGVYNCLFLGEAYANFSWPGVIFSIFWVSAIVYGCHILFLRVKKTPVTVAAYVYFTNSIVMILHGGFVDYLYNPNWYVVIAFLAAIVFGSKFIDKIFEVFYEKVHLSRSQLHQSE